MIHFVEIKFSRRSKPVPYSIPEYPQLLKEPPHDSSVSSADVYFPFTVALTFNDLMRGHSKGNVCDLTCYICQVGALSKAEVILEWNMGLVLTYTRI